MSEWAESLRAAAEAALPPVEGRLQVAGLHGPVEVIRDRWGVPHIYAEDEHDLFFGQGFVVSSERMFQMEFMARAGNGRLAEAFSELMLPLDRFIRTMGWNRAAEKLARARTQAELDAIEPFYRGQRVWFERMSAKPPEYVALDLEPLIPETFDEALVGGAGAQVLMAYTLSRNWDMELLRAEIADRLGWQAVVDLFPDLPPESGAIQAGKFGVPTGLELLQQAPRMPGGQGSNNWVVAGSRSATGRPLLANDPHLIVQVPSIWFEVHLVCPTLNASGVTLPFSPGVVIGHNERIAWGFTNTEGDVMDLYLERLSDDGSAALYEGAWEPVTIRREEIIVRGRSDPEVVEVKETRHGPILDSYLVGILDPAVVEGGVTKAYALRWVGADHGISLETVLGMDRARDWEEFRSTLRGWERAGQNMLYADVEGNIGYQLTGLYPRRRGGDGSFPVPGWSAEHEWDGFVPFEELPWSLNPEEGFLATANNRVTDLSYPHVITRDWLPPTRIRRIVELLTETERHTPETFSRIHMDTVSLTAREITPYLQALEPADDRQKEAIALLDGWEGDLAADSAAAALFEVWCVHIAREVLLPRLGPELFTHYYGRRHWAHTFRHQVLPGILEAPTSAWFGADGTKGRDSVLGRALQGAIGELTGLLGEDAQGWRWGALHTATFAGRLAIIPDLAPLFTAGVVEMGGDDGTICQSLFEPEFGYAVGVIPSWRQVMDLDNPDASVGTNTHGQSGNPASPHFGDLLPLWAEGRSHPLPLTRDRVDADAESTLVLEPGKP